MIKKLAVLSVVLSSLIASPFAFANSSRYAELHVFDARTNGPVTMNTTEINVFLDLIDMGDYLKSTGASEFNIKLSKVNSFNVNDLYNQYGSIKQITPGEIGYTDKRLGAFYGTIDLYLGRYAITPALMSRYFKGGAVIQFNFITSNNQNLYVSKMVPFYENSYPYFQSNKE